MAAAVSIAQTFELLHRPVRVPADETWIAPAIIDRTAAESRMRDLVLPHLTHRDDRDELRLDPALLYVPFWRVKLAVQAIHLPRATATRRIAIANLEFPMPIPSYGGRAGVLMIGARTAIPYTPRLPTLLGGTEDDALEVQRSDLLPLTNDRALDHLRKGEIVDADVDRDRGEDTAARTLVAMLTPPDSSSRLPITPRVESATFVLYPLWFARFGDDDGYHVLLSARDAKVASARYPRAPTISERVKRFFNG